MIMSCSNKQTHVQLLILIGASWNSLWRRLQRHVFSSRLGWHHTTPKDQILGLIVWFTDWLGGNIIMYIRDVMIQQWTKRNEGRTHVKLAWVRDKNLNYRPNYYLPPDSSATVRDPHHSPTAFIPPANIIFVLLKTHWVTWKWRLLLGITLSKVE